jgi:hypothetical protein
MSSGHSGRSFDLIRYDSAPSIRITWGSSIPLYTKRDPGTANTYEPRGFLVAGKRKKPKKISFNIEEDSIMFTVLGWWVRICLRPKSYNQDIILPCEFCFKPLWPHEYASHICDGLLERIQEEMDSL